MQRCEVCNVYRKHAWLECRCQEIDLFGEVGGISFSPDGSSFFVSIADVVYSSLQEYVVAQDWKQDDDLVY